MVGSGFLLINFCVIVAWTFVIISAIDGPYSGWFKHQSNVTIHNISSAENSSSSTHSFLHGVRVGWDGVTVCDTEYYQCRNTHVFHSGGHFSSLANGMKTAGAFAMMVVYFSILIIYIKKSEQKKSLN